ncbi:hypothetical protein EMCRGX_G029318 [Ephydatia muelleri]
MSTSLASEDLGTILTPTKCDNSEGSNVQVSSGSPPGLDGAVTKVQVRGLHSDITDEDLEAYFETPKSGGKKGAVVRCIFEEGGIACIEFNAPEGNLSGMQ